jgi:hypothetical protein
LREGVLRMKVMAATTSPSDTHEKYCEPEPRMPPPPSCHKFSKVRDPGPLMRLKKNFPKISDFVP